MSKTAVVLVTLGIALAVALGGAALAVALTRPSGPPTVTVEYPDNSGYFGGP